MTSKPTIFQAAIGAGGFYDDQLAGLAEQGLGAQAIFERLALYDIRWAAHELRGVYLATGGRDGYVSYEVPPGIAHDTDETSFQVARLFDLLSLPNVMLKIPATVEGLPAIRASIAAGINVTLIFSIARYREVVEAYLSGLEERAAKGGDLAQVASVPSPARPEDGSPAAAAPSAGLLGGGAHVDDLRGHADGDPAAAPVACPPTRRLAS